jgi:hypothetical protein
MLKERYMFEINHAEDGELRREPFTLSDVAAFLETAARMIRESNGNIDVTFALVDYDELSRWTITTGEIES